MSHQFRIRSTYDDEQWWRRVYFCEQFMLDALNRWCISDSDFPYESVVAGILHLFSRHSMPDSLYHHRLCEQLEIIAATPAEEYHSVWPQREASDANELIAALFEILEQAVASWNLLGTGNPTSGQVVERIVEEIVHQRYVIFRRHA